MKGTNLAALLLSSTDLDEGMAHQFSDAVQHLRMHLVCNDSSPLIVCVDEIVGADDEVASETISALMNEQDDSKGTVVFVFSSILASCWLHTKLALEGQSTHRLFLFLAVFKKVMPQHPKQSPAIRS